MSLTPDPQSPLLSSSSLSAEHSKLATSPASLLPLLLAELKSAATQPTSITTYRHPAGTPITDLTTLDVIHKQRHPQTGAWVTRTIRKVSPQGNNNWTTQFFLGDPNETNAIPLQTYREITITRTPHPDATESTREITKDRDTSGTLVTTSDHNVTYAFYKYGEPVKLAETQHTGTASELTTTWTYYTAPTDQASFNKPATMRRSDGQWSNITYQGSTVTGILLTKTVTGWLDNAAPAIGTAPAEAANRVVIEIEAENETGTYSREEKIQGTLVSKTWGERYKDNSGMLIDKSRVETGTATLTTLRTGYPNDASVSAADRGRLKSVLHPDGTIDLHTHAFLGDNRLVTIDSGTGTLTAVTDGTRTVSTYTQDDTLIQETIRDIATGVLLSARQAIAFDANDQPTRWAYDNDPDDYSETLNGCCGIDSTRTREGVTTSYTRDGLKRPKTAISQGITLTYTYGSKTLGSTVFPTVNITATAAGLALDQGTTVLDQAGNTLQQISPDLNGDATPEITATTRDFATRTTTTLNPDGGTAIDTRFADGQAKSTTGTATTPTYFTHAIHTQQGGGELTSQASTATGPWNRSYQNLAGRTLKSTFDDGASEIALQTHSYDTLGRLISTQDADGVTQLLAYNPKGEAYRRAIDLNQNGQIDNADRVTDTLQDVVANSPIGSAIRARSVIYNLTNNPVTVSTTYRSPDGLTTRQETLGVAAPATTINASHTARADGTWTDTTTAPDGTKTSVTYQNWLPVTQSRLDTANNVIESTTTGHDTLRRPETQTHSRTASAVVTRTAYNAINSLVVSVTDDVTTGTDRVTSFAYDSMGRRTATTLPDTTVARTSYWLTGQVKATWGSQTTPTVKLYSPEGQLTELRTFRSSNLALAPDETTGVATSDFDATTWIYNSRNLLVEKNYAGETDNGSTDTDYTHTLAGRLFTRTWERGITTTYNYTAAGELTTTDYSDATPDVTILFDKLGRQKSITTSVAKSEFTYDPATLAVDTEAISYNLDATPGYEFTRVLDRKPTSLGRETGWQLKNGSTLENEATYQYSATTGRLETVANSADIFTYDYLTNSSLLNTVTKAASGGNPALVATRTYETTRATLAAIENNAGTIVRSKYDYSVVNGGVNSLGQRMGVQTTFNLGGGHTHNSGATSWGYDNLGQLTSANHGTADTSDRAYRYDTIGNRLFSEKGAPQIPTTPGLNTTGYTPNALNQYDAITPYNVSGVAGTSAEPVFDDDGNMKIGPLTGTGGSSANRLDWDAENRLVQVRAADDTTVITTTLYDAQFRRIATTAGGTTTLYLYDGFNCIAEYTGTTLTKTRTWGMDLSGTLQGAGGVGGLLAEKQGNNTFYPTYDGNGNVSEYLMATGAVAAHFEYDPFGNIVKESYASGFDVSSFTYKFSTKPQDQETGLYYYGYRYYDPVTGRWPSRDPIGEDGGENLYGFIRNRAIRMYDLLGLADEELTNCKGVSVAYKSGKVKHATPLGGIAFAGNVREEFEMEFKGEYQKCCKKCADGSLGYTKTGSIGLTFSAKTAVTFGYGFWLDFGVLSGTVIAGIGGDIGGQAGGQGTFGYDSCEDDYTGGGSVGGELVGKIGLEGYGAFQLFGKTVSARVGGYANVSFGLNASITCSGEKCGINVGSSTLKGWLSFDAELDTYGFGTYEYSSTTDGVSGSIDGFKFEVNHPFS